MPSEPRFIGIHIDHPGARDREAGARSQAYAAIDRGLRGGRLDHCPLSEDDLVDLIHQASGHLQTLRRDRHDQRGAA